jgi:hypothetical protein
VPPQAAWLEHRPGQRLGWLPAAALLLCATRGVPGRPPPGNGVHFSYWLPRGVLAETVRALQDFGQDGNEELVLWAGSIKGRMTIIQASLGKSVKSETGMAEEASQGTLGAPSLEEQAAS